MCVRIMRERRNFAGLERRKEEDEGRCFARLGQSVGARGGGVCALIDPL